MMPSPPRSLALLALEVYQRWVSPILPPACRFHPTCAAYCSAAIRRYGVLKGAGLGFWRLLRCQPLSRGGFDPVR